MKLLLQIVGAIVLIVVFIVAYTVVTKVPRPLAGFSTQPQTVGQPGGFHLLDDVRIEASPESPMTSILFLTHLNRTSATELDTPLAEAELSETQLTLTLFDTAISPDTANAALRSGHSIPVNYPSRAQEITFSQPDNPDIQTIVIRLDRPTQYRLGVAENDPSVIRLDILE